MKFTLSYLDPLRLKADCLALPLFEEDLSLPPPALIRIDRSLRKALIQTAKDEGFRAKANQVWVFHTPDKPSKRVMLLGLGPKEKFQPEHLRMAFGSAAKALGKMHGSTLIVDLRREPPLDRSAEALRQAQDKAWVGAIVEGLILGGYRYDRYLTRQEQPPGRVKDVTLVVSKGEKDLTGQVRLSTRIAEATNWARDLVNEPGGTLTPRALADEAERAARSSGLEVEVHGRKRIQKLKMGLFLGVAQGSREEPRLIHVKYVPKDPEQAKRPPLALVGKAITFDSGGLSLKTNEGMQDMKTDMAGAAAVLGAMRVISRLKPPFPVHALLGACENMPSGDAYRPGDVLTSRLGKTVEVTNTDAEGRLVLGDILAWANEQKPRMIVDLATLTMACIIALGSHIAGVFGEDDGAVQGILDAAKEAGEDMWRLPLSELQRESLRSDVADMKNTGDRPGGAINAAVFLKEFVGRTPWVHIDIAGPSISKKERGYLGKGATGVGVRTLVEFVRRLSSSPLLPGEG